MMSSASKRASELRANQARQNSTTAAFPSTRRPSGAGDVSSKMVSSVRNWARRSIVAVEGIVEVVDGGAGGLHRGRHRNLRRGKEIREQEQGYYERGEAHGVLQGGKDSALI